MEKSKIKANVAPYIGTAKLKGKAKPKGKANVKGKADGQDRAQAQYPVYSSGAGSNGSNGWNCIQQGQPMGKPASQYVKYHLHASVEATQTKKHSLLKH